MYREVNGCGDGTTGARTEAALDPKEWRSEPGGGSAKEAEALPVGRIKKAQGWRMQ